MLRLLIVTLCLLGLVHESVAQVSVLPDGRFRFRAMLVLDSVRRYEALVSFPTPKGEVRFRQYSTAIVSELWDGKAYVVCRQTDYEIVSQARPKFPAPSGKFETLVLLDSGGGTQPGEVKIGKSVIESIKVAGGSLQLAPPEYKELLWLFPLPKEPMKKGTQLPLGNAVQSMSMLSVINGDATFLGRSRKSAQVCARFSMRIDNAFNMVLNGLSGTVSGRGEAWIRASDGFLERAEFDMAVEESSIRIPYRVVIRRIPNLEDVLR